MARSTRGILVLALLATLVGCSSAEKKVEPPPVEKDYYRELPPGAQALRRVTDPSQIPDFTRALRNRERLAEAIDNSLHYLAKPSSKQFYPSNGISHAHAVASLEAVRSLIESDLAPAQMHMELLRRFDVYTTVGFDDRGGVLFTGYYTPIFPASLEETERYRHPLHRLPSNHVKDPITGETKGLRRADGTIDPAYPDRAALLGSGALRGGELAWMANPFHAYVVGVQGSAILRLESGRHLEVGYAGNNGHEYASLGLELVRAGVLRREELNLRRMIEHFDAHPEQLAPLAAKNGRYVFFQESDGGVRGCLNEPVIPLRSIATDKTIFPRGALCYLEADLPVSTSRYRGFVLDQDAGGAIRAPGRCDIFMGVGDEAGELAGHTMSEGRLYYLFLKDDSIALGR